MKKKLNQGIIDEEGNWSTDEAKIQQITKRYFGQLFTSEIQEPADEGLRGIKNVVTDAINGTLNKEPIAEEIYAALKQMHPTKAPGSDEAFSTMLSKAVEDKSLHGIQICREAPLVSHLFFADDSILFGRANRQESATIAEIIRLYEAVSRQKINFDKLEISFSKNVNRETRETIKRHLNVNEVEKHKKYLGITTIIGRSKKAIFAGIKERVWKKPQGWKEKFLSTPGKEVLIKAVAQAIPLYIMSIFRLPDCLVDEIHGLVARFWWGAKGNERKIHWKSRENLCLPKGLGGLGFRDLKVFNLALLAKQGWRIMQNTHSLLHLVGNQWGFSCRRKIGFKKSG